MSAPPSSVKKPIEAPMRVAFVSARSDVVGGVETYLNTMVPALIERGHEAHIFVGGSGPFTRYLDEAGLAWTSVPHLGRSTSLKQNRRALRSLHAALTSFGPTLIASQSANAGMLCRLLRRRVDVPVVHTPHGWPFAPGVPKIEAALAWLTEKALSRRADAIIAVSAFDRDLALKWRVANEHQVQVIHNGVSDQLANTPPRSSGEPICEVVMVARFAQQKDHATVLRALATITDVDWRLNFVGEGPRLLEMKNLAEELGVSPAVTWSGHLDNVAPALQRADVGVLSSIGESLPISILESMSAGLPIVATRVGGVPELVTDEHNGLLVAPTRVEEMANALRRLISDPALRRAMGEASRTRFETSFTAPAMVERTINLYRSHAARPSPIEPVS